MQGRFEKRGDVGIIWINNPPVNAISVGVRQAMIDGVAKLNADADIKVGVLACEGRTFMAGADITEFGKPPLSPGFPEALAALEGSAKPIVAAIHGTALGGGLESALACHYRVAIPSAQVGLPEVKLGIQPGWGLTALLTEAVGVRRARELSATGNFLDAPTALAWGLVNHVVPHTELLPTALRLAADIAGNDGAAVRRLRELYDANARVTVAEAIRQEQTFFRAWRIDPAEIERRREHVVGRGRGQQG